MQKAGGKWIIYQLMTRLFGNKSVVNRPYGTIAENGVGKFSDITSAGLRAIAALGITHVWYTGVIEHASLTDHTEWGIPPDHAHVVKGRAGSPYAIKDYYDVNPDLAVDVPARMREFDQLIERTHVNGLKALIDFVPNHVARVYHSDAKPAGVEDLGEGDDTHVSFHRDNNFYYLPGESFSPPGDYDPLGGLPHPTRDTVFHEHPAKASGNDEFSAAPGIYSWFETAKLNYGIDFSNGGEKHFDPIPDTWWKMRDILLFWAARKVDGFRCDMAEMVPVEFWQWVIPEVRRVYPHIIFIAEIYDAARYRDYIYRGGFDYLYDKVLMYDTLRRVIAGEGSTTDIAVTRQQVEGIDHHLLHFMENHDELRIASPHFAGDPLRALPAMVISATIDRGAVMIYFGQEVGEPGAGAEGFNGDNGRTTIFDYWGVPEHQKWMNGGRFDGGKLSDEQRKLRRFYGDLLTLAGTHRAIAEGNYSDLTGYNVKAGNVSDRVHAFLRYRGDECLLVLTSFSAEREEGQLEIPPSVFGEAGLRPDQRYVAREILWQELQLRLEDDRRITVAMEPYGCYIFSIRKEQDFGYIY